MFNQTLDLLHRWNKKKIWIFVHFKSRPEVGEMVTFMPSKSQLKYNNNKNH